MDDAKELIQIVDENDNPVGEATKDEAQAKNLIHRIVIVYVKDTEGNILLQKRAATMHLFPNCWDHSAAGHVDANESYEDAAKRELGEELGVADVSLREIGHYYSNKTFEGRHLNRFHKVYEVTLPTTFKFTFQDNEVTAVRWLARQKLDDFVRDNPEQITDGLREVIERGII